MLSVVLINPVHQVPAWTQETGGCHMAGESEPNSRYDTIIQFE